MTAFIKRNKNLFNVKSMLFAAVAGVMSILKRPGVYEVKSEKLLIVDA